MSRRSDGRLFVSALESRIAPAATPYGPLAYPYTFTEIMASVRGADAMATLTALRDDDLDLTAVKQIFVQDGAALLEVGLRPGADPLIVTGRLSRSAGVAWAAPNHVVYGEVREFTPNDPSYASQYHHPLMKNNLAWDTSTGDPSVVIAVTDDGVAFNHPDLAANIWTNSSEIAGNGKDDDGNGFKDDVRGWDFSSVDSDPNPLSSDTHGTHVAGIIAARTNNGVGVAGTAGGGPNGDGVRVMPIRFYGSGSWTSSIIAQSYAYAADNGAKIVSTSYNFDGWSDGVNADPTVNSGLDYAYGKGLLLFLSAGNDGSLDPDRRNFDQALFVSSTESTDAASSFTNYGKYVDLAAPGGSILATTTSAAGTTFTYGKLSGTSMSTPNAAAVAGLIWSQNPSWSRDQVAAQLLGTTDNIDAVNPSLAGLLGTGRANSFKAVTATLAVPKLGAITGLPAESAVVPSLGTTFSVDAPMRFDPATVTAANFELRRDGADDEFNTVDDVVIPLTLNGGATYHIGVGVLNFAIAGATPVDRYRFTAKSGGLTDPFDQSLDGNGDGTAGDDFARTFTVARNVDGRFYEDRDNNGMRGAAEPVIVGAMAFLDLNNNAALDSDFATKTTAQNNPLTIADVATQTSNLTVSGMSGPIVDVNVGIDITHTYDADLDVYLTSPTGTKVELFTDVGGNGANFTNTLLDDGATLAISAGTAPFTGTYRPDGKLIDFNSASPNGTWILTVIDDANGDTGKLNSWSVTIKSGSGELTNATDANGAYYFTGLANDTYTVRALVPSGFNPAAQPAGESYSVAVTSPSSAAPDRDFGFLRQNAIYGATYNDLNVSHSYDAGDTPLANVFVFADGNSNASFERDDFISADVPKTIADLTTSISTQTVSFPATVTDLNVKIDLTHTYDGDMSISLVGPTGVTVVLSNRNGSSGDNYTATIFDDQAVTSIGSATAPFTGSYIPNGSLATFNGLGASGLWTLKIDDVAGSDVGTINSWELEFNGGAQPDEHFANSDAAGIYSLTGLTAVAHNIRRIVPTGLYAVEPTGDVHTVNLIAGATVLDKNFGHSDELPSLPPTASIKLDDGTVQRAMIQTITVTLSEPVTLVGSAAAAFTLERLNSSATPAPTGAVTLNVNPSVGPASSFTISFNDATFATQFGNAKSLIDGKYLLTLNANQIKSAATGQFLDGDGNGAGGDNKALNFHRLFGDGDGNAIVDQSDFINFRNAFNNGPSIFDYFADGDVTQPDFTEFRNRFNLLP